MPLLGFLLKLFQEETGHGLLISKSGGQKKLAFEARTSHQLSAQEGPVCPASFSQFHLQFLT